MENLVTISQGAELRGCSPQMVRYLIRRKRIALYEIAGVQFVDRDEVKAYKAQVGGRPRTKTAEAR